MILWPKRCYRNRQSPRCLKAHHQQWWDERLVLRKNCYKLLSSKDFRHWITVMIVCYDCSANLLINTHTHTYKKFTAWTVGTKLQFTFVYCWCIFLLRKILHSDYAWCLFFVASALCSLFAIHQIIRQARQCVLILPECKEMVFAELTVLKLVSLLWLLLLLDFFKLISKQKKLALKDIQTHISYQWRP